MAPIGSPTAVLPGQGLIALACHDGEGTIVWLRGEHDIASAPALSDTLTRAIALDEGDVVLDLSGVAFMGAATVGVILRARAGLRLRSRSLALRDPSVRARRVLDLCGVGL